MSKSDGELFNESNKRASRISRLVNNYERRALRLMEKVASRLNMQVWTKVRLADVFRIGNSGIAGDLFDYALKSHFDFVLTINYEPVIVLEFDGPGHIGDTAFKNDQKKERLCDYFRLPFFRIDTQYLRKLGELTVLEIILGEILCKLSPSHKPYSLKTANFDYAETAIAKVEETIERDLVNFYNLDPKISLEPICATQIVCCSELEKYIAKLLDAQFESSSIAIELVQSNGFYFSAALAILDDDTAILGFSSVHDNPNVQLNKASLAIALARLDLLDLTRMFNLSLYPGLNLQHALEYLKHFSEYAKDQGISRIFSLNPLCQNLVSDWLK